MPKARNALVVSFFDTEARDVDESDEEEDEDDPLDEFMASETVPTALTNTLKPFHYDDFYSAAREEAESIRNRHRRMLQLERGASAEELQSERATSDWTHKFSALTVPRGLLWLIRVKRGHEQDVVLTIMHWALERNDLRNILSATAPSCTHSRVYVESDSAYSVQFLTLHLHFLEPGQHPQQIAFEDYTEILSRKSTDLLAPATWARIKRSGPYFDGTVWITSSDDYNLTYDILFVPREVPSDDPEDDFDLNRKRVYYMLKGGTSATIKLNKNGIPIPHTEKKPNPPRLKKRGGLMEETGVPLRWINEDDHRPSLRDLCLFRDSKNFMLCQSSQLIHSVTSAIHHYSSFCTAKMGSSVRIMAGPFESTIGEVIDKDTATCTLYSAFGLSLTIPRTELCLNWSVGDWVKVKDGPHEGSIGWITKVDWSAVSVIVMVLPPVSADDAAIGLEQQLSIYSLVDVIYQSPDDEVAIVRDQSGNYPIQSLSGRCYNPSPLANLEVQLVMKNSEAKGAYGIIKSVNYATKSLGVLTDGLATNKFVTCGMHKVRERHTALPLLEYLKKSKSERRSIRAEREERWSHLYDPKRLDRPWVVDAVDRWQHLQSRLSSLPSTDGMDESWAPTASLQAIDALDHQISHTVNSPTPSGSSLATHKHDDARSDFTFGQPGKKRPGEWLLDEGLQGHTLDVVLRNAETQYNGEYNNLMGTVCIPNGKKLSLGNRNNSIPVRMNIKGGTQRPFKLWLIYPLTTTEFDGVISADEAVPILDACGTRLVIIGPDETDSRYHVGREGTVMAGRAVEVAGQLLSFGIDSVCRADNIPRRPKDPSTLIDKHALLLEPECWPGPAEPLAPWFLRN
ncbi:hypothetical protein C8R43DRAFT_1125488 [Mycena crocata]|nr:hypothetical protein C8R43DRAFT_1125488 [Mycena crocata]